jgi:hypothetical protein
MLAQKSFISLITLAAVISGSLGAATAHADEHRRGRGYTFARARMPVQEWNRGHWVHDRHGGRLGWWWVVGAGWYFYERPHSTVIVQQAPPVVVQQVPAPAQTVVVQAPPEQPQVAQAPSQPVIYYCKATGTNYPETMSCPGGWQIMTAMTPPQPQ